MTLSPCSYFKKLYENIEKRKKKNRKKVCKEDFFVPEYADYNKILEVNYNVSQLKSICRYYKQKVSGNKSQLTHRLYNYLKYSMFSIKIQQIFRGYMIRRIIKLKGPLLYKRLLSVNKTDFYLLNNIEDISFKQFYSFKEGDQIFCCDICSIWNLININGDKTENPYTREKISDENISNLKELIRKSKICNYNITIKLDNNIKHKSLRKKMEFEVYNLFAKMDEYGIITNALWLLNLTRQNMIRFIREVHDIFFYRANLTPPIKIKICPPIGNPFYGASIKDLAIISNDQILKRIIIIIKNLITKSNHNDFKIMGTYYVLGALTIVNLSARESLPWLYESFKY